MSTPYGGANSFPATIPVLDDGDDAEALTWAPALEGLADRTIYLQTKLNLGQTITRLQPLIAIQSTSPANYDPARWLWISEGSSYWRQEVASARLYIPLTDVPDKSSLTKLRLMVSGGGHTVDPGASAYGDMQLWYVDSTGVAQLATPNAFDAPASLAAFNAVHEYELVLDTPLAIDNATDPLAIYLEIDGVSNNFEASKYSVRRLVADFLVDS